MAAALPLSAETDYLPAGERQVIISAVDSRGLRGSQTVTIPVLPYSPPEISGAFFLFQVFHFLQRLARRRRSLTPRTVR